MKHIWKIIISQLKGSTLGHIIASEVQQSPRAKLHPEEAPQGVNGERGSGRKAALGKGAFDGQSHYKITPYIITMKEETDFLVHFVLVFISPIDKEPSHCLRGS